MGVSVEKDTPPLSKPTLRARPTGGTPGPQSVALSPSYYSWDQLWLCDKHWAAGQPGGSVDDSTDRLLKDTGGLLIRARVSSDPSIPRQRSA